MLSIVLIYHCTIGLPGQTEGQSCFVVGKRDPPLGRRLFARTSLYRICSFSARAPRRSVTVRAPSSAPSGHWWKLEVKEGGGGGVKGVISDANFDF